MTNFDLFTKEKAFSAFVEAAVAAERIYRIDPAACVMNCRRAMECAVKWMYSVDDALSMPYQDKLVSLMNTEDFRSIVDENLRRQENHKGTSRALLGESLYLSRFCGVLLRQRLSGEAL